MSEELINQVPAEETAESTVNIDQNKYIVINAPNADKIVSVHEEGGQDGLLPSGGTTGQVVTKKSDKDFDVEWVDGGAADYTELENKPSINNVTLEGNKTSSELDLQSKIIREKSTDSSSGIFNLHIDDSSESAAASVKIKGNTFSVWQLISSDPSTTVITQPGRYYYSCINGVENILVSTGETIQGSSSNGDLVYDLTFSRFTAEEVADLETFKEAWYKKSGIPFTNQYLFTFDGYSDSAGFFEVAPAISVFGRNLFNEEVGSDDGGGWYARDPIYVTPNTTYYVTSPYPLLCTFADRWSDTDISTETVQNGEIIAPDNAGLLYLQCEGHEYDGGVCINVSDPAFNGTYEPYTEIGSIYDESIHLWGIDDIKDEFDVTTGVITHRINRRAYQEGDELDTSVVTDFDDTYYVLPEPVTETVTSYVLNLSSEYNEVILFAGAPFLDNIFSCFGDISIKYYDKDFVLPDSDSIPHYVLSEEDPDGLVDFFQKVLKAGNGYIVAAGDVLTLSGWNSDANFIVFQTSHPASPRTLRLTYLIFNINTGEILQELNYSILNQYSIILTSLSGTLSIDDDQFTTLMNSPKDFTLHLDMSCLNVPGYSFTSGQMVDIPYSSSDSNNTRNFSTLYFTGSFGIAIAVNINLGTVSTSTYRVLAMEAIHPVE